MLTVTMDTPRFQCLLKEMGLGGASSVAKVRSQERYSLPERPSLPSPFNQL